MSARTLAPADAPAYCWEWLSPEDVLRHALAAYYAAQQAIQPPPGEAWLVDGEVWSDRGSFRDCLLGLLAQRINRDALAAGIGPPRYIWPDLPKDMEWPAWEGV